MMAVSASAATPAHGGTEAGRGGAPGGSEQLSDGGEGGDGGSGGLVEPGQGGRGGEGGFAITHDLFVPSLGADQVPVVLDKLAQRLRRAETKLGAAFGASQRDKVREATVVCLDRSLSMREKASDYCHRVLGLLRLLK